MGGMLLLVAGLNVVPTGIPRSSALLVEGIVVRAEPSRLEPTDPVADSESPGPTTTGETFESAQLDVQPGEGPILRILGQLAASEHAEVSNGIRAARAHGSVIFDRPLRRILAGPAPVPLRVAAAEALGSLDWPRAVEALQGRIDALGRAMFSDAEVIRWSAIDALGHYPTPAAQRLLRLRFEGAPDSDRLRIQQARQAARGSETLARLGEWLSRPQTDEDLLGVSGRFRLALAGQAVLSGPDTVDAERAIGELRRAREPIAVRPVIAFAATHGNESARLLAVEELRRRPLSRDVDDLVRWLSDPDVSFRRAVIEALGQHQSVAVGEALATYLVAESSTDLQKRAANALRYQPWKVLGQVLPVSIRAAEGYAQQLLVFLARERGGGPEMIWAKTLAYAVDPSEDGLAALLVEDPVVRCDQLLPRLAWKSLADAERVAVLMGLSGSTEPRVLKAALFAIAVDATPEIIRAAGKVLASFSDDSVLPHLAQVLRRAEGPQRGAVYEVLRGRGSPAARAMLATAIQTETDPDRVSKLIREQTVLGHPELIGAVANRLQLDEDRRVLTAALVALQGVPDATLADTYAELTRAPAVGRESPPSGFQPLGENDRVRALAYDRLTELRASASARHVKALATDPEIDPSLRLRAIRDLGLRGSAEDVPALEGMLVDDVSDVRAAARHALHSLAPEQYPEWDQLGRYPLVLAATGFGATLLVLSTNIAEQKTREDVKDVSKVLVGVTGAALGGGTTWLLTLESDISLGEAGYVTTLGTWGLVGGHSLARVAGWGEGERTAPLWAALGGELAGVGVGALTMRSSRFAVGDVVTTNLVAASWGAGALSLAHLARAGGGPAGAADAFAVGGLAAVAPMALLSPRLKIDANTVAGVVTSIGFASWVGAFAPRALIEPEDRKKGDVIAGIGFGQAVGLAGGLALSRLTEFEPETVFWATVGGLSGAAAGVGYGMSEPSLNNRWRYGLLEAGTLVGAGTLAWLGPRLEFSGTDLGLVLLMTGSGAALGARIPERVAEEIHLGSVEQSAEKEARWGGAMLGGALGLYAGLASSQFVDLTGGELAMTGVSAAVLGAGGAGLTLLLPEIGDSFSSAVTAGAAIGAVGVGAFLAPRMRYEPADISLGVSTAALGSFLGSFVTAYRTDEDDPLPDSEQEGGALLGGALGLCFAGAVSQFTDVKPRRVLRVDMGALGGMAIGAGLGMVLPKSLTPDYDRRLTVALMQGGTVAGYAIATITERKSQYDLADRFHMGLAASLGAWHGAWIPYLWRDAKDPDEQGVPDSEVTGGALLGLGVGGVLGRLVVKIDHKDGGDVFELGLWDALGTSLGAGLWGLSRAGRRTRFAMMDGAGFAAWLAAEALVNQTRFSKEDRGMVAVMTAMGGVGGLGLPFLLLDQKPTGQQVASGAALGAGVLGLSSIGLTQFVEYGGDDLAEAVLTSALTSAGAWGVMQARSGSTFRKRLQLADLGLFTGLGLGLATAPFTEFSAKDRWWMAGGGLLGGWIGAWTPQLLHGDDLEVDQQFGAATAGAAIGTALTATAAQWFDAPRGWVIGAMGVSGASALTAAGWAVLDRPEPSKHQALSMQLAAVGGFAAAGLLAPRASLTASDYGTIGTLAGVGAWHGLFMADALKLDAEHGRAGGTMAGTGAGMLAGYVLSQAMDRDWADNVETVLDTAYGSAIGGGLGLMLGKDSVYTARALELGGLLGTAVGIGLARFTDYPHERRPLVGAAGLWGAWHGLWLGEGLSQGEERAQRMGGGALFGFGTGLAVGSIASQLLDVEARDLAETSVLMGAGNLAGVGLGKMLSLDSSLTTAMLEAGGVAGIAVGLGVAEHTQYRGADVPLIALSGVVGGAHGAMLGLMVGPEANDGEAAWSGTLLGTGVGLASGVALSQGLELTVGDLLEVGLATMAGDAVGAGVGQWLRLDRTEHLALVGAGGLALTGLSFWAAEQTSFDRSDRIFTLMGATYGGWLGAWAPLIWNEDGSDELGSDVGLGLAAGVGAGLVLGAGASQLLDHDLGDVGEIGFGTTMASVLGAGVGLLAQPDTDLWVSLMEATGVAGLAAVTAVAPSTSYSKSDAVVGGLASLYGVYQGAGLSLLADGDDRQVAGAMMTAGAAGALLGSYLGPYLQLDGTDILMLLAGSAWGVWIGIWSASAIDRLDLDDERNPYLLGVGTTAVATDVTLMATSVAISQLVEMPPKQFAWISVAGGVGLVGGLLGSYMSGDRMSPQMGIAAGSAGGLLIGTVVTSFFHWDPPVYGRIPAPQLQQSRALAWLPQVDQWFPAVNMMPVGDREGLSPQSGTRVLMTVTGTLK